MIHRTTETIIYGGAFNPPTRAHQAVLQACIDLAENRQAEVWLLPSGHRRDKVIDIPFERRLELFDALIKDIGSRTAEVAVCTAELERQTETQTFETVRILAAAHPDRHFRWVFGSDSVASMPTWNHGEWLRRNLAMLVVKRPGSPSVRLTANAALLAVKQDVVSSTEVRRRIVAGEAYDKLVGLHVGAVLARSMIS